MASGQSVQKDANYYVAVRDAYQGMVISDKGADDSREDNFADSSCCYRNHRSESV